MATLTPTELPTELQVLAATRVFVAEHVASQAAGWERGARDSAEVLPIAAKLGLLGLQVPAAQGGAGLSYTCKMRVAELIAGADFGLAMSLVNTHNIADHLAREAAPDLARRYVPELLTGRRIGCTALTEPGTGSDFAAITTTARAVEGGWQLSGRKAWITNAAHADVIVVYAQTQPGSGAAGIAAFVVDAGRAGFERDPRADISGVRSMGTGGFGLVEYFCAADEMLHSPGQAFKYALHSINGARVYVAAMCCGMVGEALRIAAAFGQDRHAFGQPLHRHQGWRWSLANAAVDLDAARAMVAAAAVTIDAGRDVQGAAARAKIFATRMAQQHIAALLNALGAQGLDAGQPLLRHLAAAQVAALVDGSTGMLLERVARELREA